MIQTPKMAKLAGHTRYFTGHPCSRGHIAPRVAVSRACVECLAILSVECRERNIERFAEKEKLNREKFAEHRRKYARQRYVDNRQAIRSASEKWRKANRAIDAAKAARRKAAKLRATPLWADHEKIVEFYKLAAEITKKTGIQHEVDHIIPIQGELVCGLHVHTNLQILTKSENSRKKNKLITAALGEGE